MESAVPHARRGEDDDTGRSHRGISGQRQFLKVVGFVGRMVPQQGIPALLDIAVRLAHSRPDVVLVVVGDGPLLDWARTRAEALSLRNVRFAGAHADVVPFMHLFDILAVTSAWEPFGIVSIEAMAAGVPVVAFDIDGVGEAVIDGVTGFLVSPHDTLAFSAKVVELCDDGVMRRTIGEAGRIHAAQRFDAGDMAREMEKVYTGLSGRLRVPRRSTR
ncbi:MAG: glycosyltransferase family 4 protein [Gemmatimonadaceae bacterium]